MSAPIDAPATEPIDDEVSPPPLPSADDLDVVLPREDPEEEIDDDESEPSDRNEEERESPEPELVPKTEPQVRVLWSESRKNGRQEREYLQAPLNTFPKLELYGILGEAIKIVLEADTGVDVQTLMDMTNPRRVMSQIAARLPGAEDAPVIETTEQQREMDAMKIMAAFAEVVAVAPGLLKRAYCVILNIPTGHRVWAIEHALDNLSDDETFDILETFIDQSWSDIEAFFTQWLPRMAQRTVKARQRAEEKRRSSGTSRRR